MNFLTATKVRPGQGRYCVGMGTDQHRCVRIAIGPAFNWHSPEPGSMRAFLLSTSLLLGTLLPASHEALLLLLEAGAVDMEARAEQAAFSARERLTRLMGLWGAQADFRLADRLPDLPKDVTPMTDIEARALRERLDVRSVMAQSRYVAEQMGFTRVTGYVDGMSIGLIRNSVFDNDTGTKASNRGVELELPLPIFDWGGARNARSRAVYMQSVSQVQEAAVNARSEAREAYFAYRTTYDLARHYRDEVVPLRKFIGEEMLLRYNGMLASTWDLLADSRAQVMAVNSAIEAQRDFWLAETDLQTALTGTSPGAMAGATVSVGGGGGDAAAGH